MTVIEVSFLTGRYSATSHHDREQSEWPPHGARLFSAMVAAWADAEPARRRGAGSARMAGSPAASPNLRAGGSPAPGGQPFRAGQRRQRDPPVSVPASGARHGGLRCAVRGRGGELAWRVDEEGRAGCGTRSTRSATSPRWREASAARTSRPLWRCCLAAASRRSGTSRRSRWKATRASDEASPLPDVRHVPPVTYAWDEVAPPETAEALDALLARVTRLGHSSSLVSCRLRDEAPPATHTPGDGALMMRWVRAGQLAALEQEHERHQAIRPRSLPFRGIRYREAEPSKADRRDHAAPRHRRRLDRVRAGAPPSAHPDDSDR